MSGNACRYCAAPIEDDTLFFCPPPARCQQANSRSNRPAAKEARAAVIDGLRLDPDRPSLLDRDPIENDPDQMEMW